MIIIKQAEVHSFISRFEVVSGPWKFFQHPPGASYCFRLFIQGKRKAMSGELLLSTEAQERLSALLVKAIDLLPYANDDSCNYIFAIVAQFCQEGLRKKSERKQAKFASLDIEELIALARQLEAQEAAENSVSTPISPTKTRKSAPRNNKRSRESEQEEEDSSSLSKSKKAITRWECSKAYNIIEVTDIREDPFQINVMARPPVAGNQKPLPYFMNQEDFDSVQHQKGRSGTKLRSKLTEALQTYCDKAKDYPRVLIDNLKAFDWGKDLGHLLSESK